jgi:hypothetical protein
MAISEIKPADISRVVQPLITKKEFETAKRVPTPKTQHRLAITDPKEVGQLLRAINNYQGTFVVQCAFKLSPLLFQRPGEICAMQSTSHSIRLRNLSAQRISFFLKCDTCSACFTTELNFLSDNSLSS